MNRVKNKSAPIQTKYARNDKLYIMQRKCEFDEYSKCYSNYLKWFWTYIEFGKLILFKEFDISANWH